MEERFFYPDETESFDNTNTRKEMIMEVFGKIEAAVTEKTQIEDFVKGYVQGDTFGGTGSFIEHALKSGHGSLGALGWEAAERYENFGDLLEDVAEQGGALDEIIELRDEYNEQTGSNVQLPASLLFPAVAF
jgi:hypothetical protein